jgi:hypothetical protein
MWPICEACLKDVPFCLLAMRNISYLLSFQDDPLTVLGCLEVRCLAFSWRTFGSGLNDCGGTRYYCWLYVASMILLQGYRGSAVPCVGQLRNGGSLVGL